MLGTFIQFFPDACFRQSWSLAKNPGLQFPNFALGHLTAWRKGWSGQPQDVVAWRIVDEGTELAGPTRREWGSLNLYWLVYWGWNFPHSLRVGPANEKGISIISFSGPTEVVILFTKWIYGNYMTAKDWFLWETGACIFSPPDLAAAYCWWFWTSGPLHKNIGLITTNSQMRIN